jgi:CrcB protein
MERLLWISLAGAAGCASRYLIGLWAAARFGTTFPYGTLIVNLVGCFLIAFVTAIALGVASFPPTLRLALTTGFLGGFTTYSSFNIETTHLLQEGALGAALVNVGLTTIGGFAAGLAGLALGRLIVPH